MVYALTIHCSAELAVHRRDGDVEGGGVEENEEEPETDGVEPVGPFALEGNGVRGHVLQPIGARVS
jgi:hypothetical protein